ncbi:MAG TPA: hypothetical protein VM008_06550 [Phycisphaerae bacterium]|nr:hypothetical protein [Phycisphaerae bacterium]
MITYSLGTALVTHDEISEREQLGQFAALRKGAKTDKLQLSNGFLLASDLVSPAPPAEDNVAAGNAPNDLVPIGMGKPLTVGIREIYTGNNPHGFFIGPRGMLLASAMKSNSSFAAAPRAVNYLQQISNPQRRIREVDAVTQGTPIVFYTPALTSLASVVTIEMMFEGFPKDEFDAIGGLFTGAGGIPLFAAASTYLLAAGTVTKLIGSVGKALANGTPVLRQTEPINFITPGTNAPVAKFALLTRDNADPTILNDYKINDSGSLISISGNTPYDGDEPYVILYLDGREVDDYKNFAPTAASAAILDRFYNIGDGQTAPADALISAMKVVNDVAFRQQALQIKEQLTKVTPGTPEAAALNAKYDAYVKNILDPSLKPTA